MKDLHYSITKAPFSILITNHATISVDAVLFDRDSVGSENNDQHSCISIKTLNTYATYHDILRRFFSTPLTSEIITIESSNATQVKQNIYIRDKDGIERWFKPSLIHEKQSRINKLINIDGYLKLKIMPSTSVILKIYPELKLKPMNEIIIKFVVSETDPMVTIDSRDLLSYSNFSKNQLAHGMQCNFSESDNPEKYNKLFELCDKMATTAREIRDLTKE